MTESSSDTHRDMSIEALRQRVLAVESRFMRIDDENNDYQRRLADLMAALDDDQHRRREEVETLTKKIASVVAENVQLREILDEVLTAAETFGEGRPDETLAELGTRVGKQQGSKDIFSEAAERIGMARTAAENETSDKNGAVAPAEGGSEPDEPVVRADAAEAETSEPTEALLPLEPVKETEPVFAADGEAQAEQIHFVEPDEIITGLETEAETDGEAADAGEDEAGERSAAESAPDAAEAAADGAPEEDVLELETEAPEPDVEIIPPSRPDVEKTAEMKPEEKQPEAAKEEKDVEITTDKETDQLDRILASIRRITSAL